MDLSQREKTLILIAVLILLPLMLFRFVLLPVSDKQHDLGSKIEVLTKKIDQANLLGQEYLYLIKETKLQSTSLSKKIETLLRQNDLKGRSKIVVEDQPNGGQRLILKLDEVNLSELSNIIFIIENSKPIIKIDNIDINPSYKSKKLLRISMALTSN